MLTNNGFELERFDTSASQIEQEIQNSFGGGVDVSTDSLMGILYSLFTRAESQTWEKAQGVHDSIGLMSAEENMLDNVALLVGQVRFPASYTKGEVWVTAKGGTVIPKTQQFSSVLNDKFYATQEQIITATSCQNLRLYVNTLTPSTLYSIEVNLNNYTFTSSGNPTPSEILATMQALLVADGDLSLRFVPDLVDDNNSYLEISKIDRSQNMVISASSFFTLDYITTPVLVRAVVAGEVPANTGTINSLDNTTIDGVYLISNPTDLPTGNNRESDASLRERILQSYVTVAGGTPDAVHNGVAAVEGVRSVKVVENRSITPVSGIPPKSLKVIVFGGNNLQVGTAIWENKAAGIHTWTDRNNSDRAVVQTITDFNEQEHIVQFTRPDIKYIWVKVEYTKYKEEAFTSGGETIMKEVVATTGNSLGIGDDVIPKRFVGPLYKNVKGLKDLTISVAVKDNANDVPLTGEYSEVRVPISNEEITNFSSSRVIVVDNTP